VLRGLRRATREARLWHPHSVSIFSSTLRALNDRTAPPRRFVFVPYDQLHQAFVPADEETGVVVVECPQKARRRPYHRQKLALVLTNLRHFALEAAAAGHRVVHVVSAGDYAQALEQCASQTGPVTCARPAERELRVELQPLVERGLVSWTVHPGWLSNDEDFAAASKTGAPPWRMDSFYRALRRRTGILMDGDKPRGGRFSFDGDNRQPYAGEPKAPALPRFVIDDVTREVVSLVESIYATHPGEIDAGALPATRADARTLWAWAKSQALPHFGPFEDAMSLSSRTLFHANISAVLNLHRLLPREVIDDVLTLDLPLSSQEGFLRQVLGWREFVHHVHEKTDGFRRWSRAADTSPSAATTTTTDSPSYLGASEPLPAAFWPPTQSTNQTATKPMTTDASSTADPSSSPWQGAPSGLFCLDTVVRDVWETGYSHHITRLMVLANIATLLDIEPRALTDWFWAAYTDAYDWVVEPNVLGMGSFAVGDVMTTKPYVAGSAYIDKMSDYCGSCAFRPGKPVSAGGCPLTSLYWAFLARHAEPLASVERMKLPLASARKRTAAQRVADEQVFAITRKTLAERRRLTPSSFAALKE
jgi:deoxyribodipyrimidine photolyase-related protein